LGVAGSWVETSLAFKVVQSPMVGPDPHSVRSRSTIGVNSGDALGARTPLYAYADVPGRASSVGNANAVVVRITDARTTRPKAVLPCVTLKRSLKALGARSVVKGERAGTIDVLTSV
jgi:hypothetical protein